MDTNERRLHDAKLGAAIDNAAANLPDRYVISIEIEKGSAFVNLVDPNGIECNEFTDETLADEIYNAVARSIAEAKFEQSLLNREP